MSPIRAGSGALNWTHDHLSAVFLMNFKIVARRQPNTCYVNASVFWNISVKHLINVAINQPRRNCDKNILLVHA